MFLESDCHVVVLGTIWGQNTGRIAVALGAGAGGVAVAFDPGRPADVPNFPDSGLLARGPHARSPIIYEIS